MSLKLTTSLSQRLVLTPQLRQRIEMLQMTTLELTDLIREGRASILGPIRQELLSGVPADPQYQTLRSHLRAFTDLDLSSEDYEEAALFFNRCRGRGIQGSNTDFLICAVAVRRRLGILTTDADFVQFARVLPIHLHSPRQ